MFAYLRLKDGPDPAQEKAIAALEQAGQPVVRVEFANTLQLGQAFFLWEFATAVAGSIIGIDAFDQPDVEASKIVTKKLTSAYNDEGKLPDETPFLTDGAIQLFSDAKNATELARAGNTLEAVMKAHLARLGAGDYAALLAYIQRTPEHIRALLQELRMQNPRTRRKSATVAEFAADAFLHSHRAEPIRVDLTAAPVPYSKSPSSTRVYPITSQDVQQPAGCPAVSVIRSAS